MDSPNLGTPALHRGAEADLILSTLGEWRVVVKQRVRKYYRHPKLDAQIRRERTLREALALHAAKQSGVKTPSLLGLDLANCSIAMTFVEGYGARDQLDHLPSIASRNLFRDLGDQIGRLHRNGWVHGDLTTSNIIFATNGFPFVLDFGMSSRCLEPEERGVDLHLLNRSLTTSHPLFARPCMRAVVEGYKKALGTVEAEASLRKQAEIARRGRYFAIR